MRVAFHSNTLTVRGSENALWDYAEFNESILGNRSILAVADRPGMEDNPTLARWRTRFPVLVYHGRRDLECQLRQHDVEVLYMIKPGHYDGLVVPGVRNCVHSMFLSDEFHGDRFAYVSSWSSRVMTGRNDSFVPHLVKRFHADSNLRKKLGIPNQARVFGRHGGWETFNIPFVRKVVACHAANVPGDHFIFLNTRPIRGTESMANVHYLPATMDPREKAKFLATCDAMIHARDTGETFGLAVAEFAVLGKPVITFAQSKEQAHLEMLGSQARLYKNERGLASLMRNFVPTSSGRTEYSDYADPQIVMRLFQRIFLD